MAATSRVSVGVLGASGTTGGELVRLLLDHPGADLVFLGAREWAGRSLGEVHPHLAAWPLGGVELSPLDEVPSLDVAFLSLPHGESARRAPELLESGARVIDLAGDFRLPPQAYPHWYGFDHPASSWTEKVVYGLTELFREQILGAQLVANPGCFPTPVVVGLAPLLREGLIEPGRLVVDGKTGLSGAGRTVTEATTYTSSEESVRPYRVPLHQHTPEIEHALALSTGIEVRASFVPHLVPAVRGVLTTCYAEAAGATAGMKPSGRPDMGLLVADPVQSVAGLFTTNAFAAAPVRLSAQRVSRGLPRAVVVNSGHANAGTGLRGDRDSERTTAAVADALQLEASDVLACSTGVIGESLHMDRYLGAIPELVSSLSDEGGDAFAEAIMTTDVVPKVAAAERAGFRVGGCAKGGGMIAPHLHLGTKLVFITTDAPIPPPEIRRLATETLEPRFESLTVDACTSTNDTVLLFASGAAGGDLVVAGTDAWVEVTSALEEVATSLLLQLAADAEGANHVILVVVSGAETEQHAQIVAREIAESILVKTAIFGGDPNPGRILQAIGSSGAPFLPQLVDGFIGDIQVIDAGEIAPSYSDGGNEAARLALVEEREVVVSVTLGNGEGRSRMIGVDLSYDYVKINAEYST